MCLSAGQRHESKYFETLVESVALQGKKGRPRSRPDALAGDNAYANRRIRGWCHSHRVTPVLPENKKQRANRAKRRGAKPKLNKALYRRRNIVERLIGWLKINRRISMRFEKLAENFLAFVHLAAIRMILRRL